MPRNSNKTTTRKKSKHSCSADRIRANEEGSEIARHEEYQAFYFVAIQSAPRGDPLDTSRKGFSILDTLAPFDNA